MQLTDPAAFDAFLTDATLDRVAIMDSMEKTPLWLVRRLQLSMTLADFTGLSELLTTLPDVAPARGVALVVRGAVGDLKAAEEVDLSPRGILPLEMEESCYQHFAAAISAAQSGDYEKAHWMNQTAVYIAGALGMKNRLQALKIELARVAALKGTPTPDALREHLLQPMPVNRRQWAQRTLAESLMALGNYQAALHALGSPSGDSTGDAALREFLCAMLGLPTARLHGDPLLDHSIHYAALAAGIRRAEAGDTRLDLPKIVGMPQAGYALLAEASANIRTPRLAQQGVRMLEEFRPVLPDQRFFRLVTLISCVIRGLEVTNGHLLCEQLHSALGALEDPEGVMAVLRRVSPVTLVTLALGPPDTGLPTRALNLQAVPILAGKVLLYQGAEFSMPGRAGRSMLREAMGVMDDPLQRIEKRRMTEALAAAGAPCPVNLGAVAMGALRMIDVARHGGRPGMAASWRTAHIRMIGMMTSDVMPEPPVD